MGKKIKDDILLELCLSGLSQKEMANQLKCTDATISRRIHSPDFSKLLNETRKKLRNDILNDLTISGVKAVKILTELLDEDNPSIKLQSASKILMLIQNYSDQMDIYMELENIKEQIENNRI